MITIQVSGNICADAIIKNVNGKEVINFTVASNRRYKNKQGEIKEEVTFIFCQQWQRSEKTANLLTKGRAISVNGRLAIKNYVGNDGAMRPFHTLTVADFQLFSKPRKEEKQLTITEHDSANDYPETEHPPLADIVDDLPF